jgi:hypothetical protein
VNLHRWAQAPVRPPRHAGNPAQWMHLTSQTDLCLLHQCLIPPSSWSPKSLLFCFLRAESRHVGTNEGFGCRRQWREGKTIHRSGKDIPIQFKCIVSNSSIIFRSVGPLEALQRAWLSSDSDTKSPSSSATPQPSSTTKGQESWLAATP